MPPRSKRQSSGKSTPSTSQRHSFRRSATIDDVQYTETHTYDTNSDTTETPSSNRRPIRNYSPTRVGTNTSSGIGLLEAEYFGCVFLLILALFAGSGTYGSKMMSFMKRGVLVSILFFFLALISSTGPNAMKITKAFGGLVFVAILIASPTVGFLGMLDNLFKANWVGTTEHGTDVGSSNTGAQGSSSGALGAASGALQRITQIIESFGLGFIK